MTRPSLAIDGAEATCTGRSGRAKATLERGDKRMTIVRQAIVYEGPGGPFEGVVAYDDSSGVARPGVLVIPNVLGQKEADNLKAEGLARLGYVGFACDV